ncbi:TetR family transcriptional regulator [Aeromonas sp. A35_P]|uniref:TetR/AcrR family transcriptional regulator n=1 Tax=Aeromonas sp. A35_P TaxID=1983805 RepID=UPI000B9B4418|nr:TetR/AcrR family transcriptional regulator [Aeromonas sp. A35_P]OZG39941.1 TetR family transcriptional regulator [Aeromonas sp. A35_P]
MTESSSSSNAEQRRAAILQAAADLFFERGYAATSIDAIIERVGGSKRSIYSEFGNKEGLFSALVAECSVSMTEALTLPELAGRGLAQTMHALGERMMSNYMHPTMIGIYRTTLMEAHRFPEWAQSFYDEGPKRAIETLARVLEQAKASGQLREIDCQLAATHFIGMLKDNFYYQVVLGLRPPLTDAEIAQTVGSVVDIFLHGIEKA